MSGNVASRVVAWSAGRVVNSSLRRFEHPTIRPTNLRSIFRCVLALWLYAQLTSACLPSANPPAPASAPETIAATLIPPNQTLIPTVAPTTVSASSTLTLVVWMSDEFAQAPAASGGQALTTAIEGFQVANAPMHVAIQPKKAYGKGGMADLLVSTQNALPQALPDVVTLDMRELPSLAREDILQPFDNKFAPALQADLYPFARQSGQVDGRVYGIPFTADLLQVAYDNTQFKTPPLTWSDLISSSAKYGVALGGENGTASDSLLAQYVALGGHFNDARAKPTLERTPLRDALEFFRNGIAGGLISAPPLNLKSVDETWRLFTAAKASVVDTSTRKFLAERNRVKGAGFATVPTRDGNLVSISRSWGYAIVARDTARRDAAQKFVEWMLGVENTALWNRATNRLPVRRSALPLWSTDMAYRDFANQLLNVAVHHPPITSGNSLDAILQVALVDVLANNVSAADAADKAIATLTR